MERTHPKSGSEALLQYTVSKRHDDEGNALFLLAETYESAAGVENHSRLAHEDVEDPVLSMFQALVAKCETIGGGASDVLHSLW